MARREASSRVLQHTRPLRRAHGRGGGVYSIVHEYRASVYGIVHA